MSVSIQKMKISDVEKCSKIICESILGQKYGYKDEKIKNMMIDLIEKEENIYTAIVDEDVVGLVWYDLKGAFSISPYLRLIIVDKKSKGMKVGTSLIDFYEEQCRKTNKQYFLLVSDFNVEAIKFYEKRGYEKIGLIPSFVKKEINEIIMIKRNENIKDWKICYNQYKNYWKYWENMILFEYTKKCTLEWWLYE